GAEGVGGAAGLDEAVAADGQGVGAVVVGELVGELGRALADQSDPAGDAVVAGTGAGLGTGVVGEFVAAAEVDGDLAGVAADQLVAVGVVDVRRDGRTLGE
ncbi:hypothetical protein, partial [Kitasatospora sp. NPDC056731]|uniref:hypothetical protein n=1 Tax=Kitasatospora sp. NPDC056731 TaxID=3155422 RepID=UPI0034215061